MFCDGVADVNNDVVDDGWLWKPWRDIMADFKGFARGKSGPPLELISSFFYSVKELSVCLFCSFWVRF